MNIFSSQRSKHLAVAATCAAAGAVAGIAGAAAAPSGHSGHATRHAYADRSVPGPGRPDMDGPPVHAEEVVLNRAGTAFITATEDSGTVKSVGGDQLSITEGVGQVTYKDQTLTIPSGATVVRNFQKASLSDLKPGDHVHVRRSSDGTFVFAADSSARPPFEHRRGPWDGHGPGGPPPPMAG